ncbi:MAG TPA: phage holin family protein [Saprospiraceae bacterium]|jgi:phage-related holin|nr:phage holin family protein [Saprospiraceae bacterium]
MRPLLIDIFHLKNSDSVFIRLILSIIGAIIGYFTNMINENSNAFVAIGLVVFADFGAGIFKAIYTNTFEIKKALKVVWYFGAYSVLLAIMLSIEKGFQYASWISEAVMLPIIIFQIISMLKNLSIIGIIPKGVLLKILENIDNYKDNVTNINSDINTDTLQ